MGFTLAGFRAFERLFALRDIVPKFGGVYLDLPVATHMGVSENRGPQYSTLNSRIIIIRAPK